MTIKPIALCLERLEPLPSPGEPPFVRCTALAPDEPGLSLDRAGQIRWMSPGPTAALLLATADDGLQLRRVDPDVELLLHRGGRRAEVQPEQQISLLGGDELELLVDDDPPRTVRLRVHMHGRVTEPSAPEALERPWPPPEVQPEVDVRVSPPIAPPDVLERQAGGPARRGPAARVQRSHTLYWVVVGVVLVAVLLGVVLVLMSV